MRWLTTIQLIKLNNKLPKNESNLRNHIRLFKDFGKFAYNLFINPKKKRMATIYSTLEEVSKIDLLSKSIAFAKREIADNGNPTNRPIEQIASDYVWQSGVLDTDYSIIQPQIITIVAWVGPLPKKLPRP